VMNSVPSVLVGIHSGFGAITPANQSIVPSPDREAVPLFGRRECDAARCIPRPRIAALTAALVGVHALRWPLVRSEGRAP
jgi:hypothetical protein